MNDERPVTPTEYKVVQMLGENTGAALMDSGMHGRAWQRFRQSHGLDGALPNSAWDGGPSHRPATPTDDQWHAVVRALRNEPEAWVDKYGCFYGSTFSFMSQAFEYLPALDAHLQAYIDRIDGATSRSHSDLELMQTWVDRLVKHGKVGGIYGDSSGPICDNTYNGESILDRTLQYVQFEFESGACGTGFEGKGSRCERQGCDMPLADHDFWLPNGVYVIIQVHGGADVRGGYTRPVLFACSSDEGILDQGTFGLSCERSKHEGDTGHTFDTGYGGYGSLYTETGTQLRFCYHERHEDVGPREALAEWDDDKEAWLCPYDQTILTPFYWAGC